MIEDRSKRWWKSKEEKKKKKHKAGRGWDVGRKERGAKRQSP